jgi:hypothetical protein
MGQQSSTCTAPPAGCATAPSTPAPSCKRYKLTNLKKAKALKPGFLHTSYKRGLKPGALRTASGTATVEDSSNSSTAATAGQQQQHSRVNWIRELVQPRPPYLADGGQHRRRHRRRRARRDAAVVIQRRRLSLGLALFTLICSQNTN